MLWELTTRALAVGLNAWHDEELGNLAYTEEESEWFARAYTDDWTLVRWRQADILLVMRK